jgi:hypothetical protein
MPEWVQTKSVRTSFKKNIGLKVLTADAIPARYDETRPLSKMTFKAPSSELLIGWMGGPDPAFEDPCRDTVPAVLCGVDFAKGASSGVTWTEGTAFSEADVSERGGLGGP